MSFPDSSPLHSHFIHIFLLSLACNQNKLNILLNVLYFTLHKPIAVVKNLIPVPRECKRDSRFWLMIQFFLHYIIFNCRYWFLERREKIINHFLFHFHDVCWTSCFTRTRWKLNNYFKRAWPDEISVNWTKIDYTIEKRNEFN